VRDHSRLRLAQAPRLPRASWALGLRTASTKSPSSSELFDLSLFIPFCSASLLLPPTSSKNYQPPFSSRTQSGFHRKVADNFDSTRPTDCPKASSTDQRFGPNGPELVTPQTPTPDWFWAKQGRATIAGVFGGAPSTTTGGLIRRAGPQAVSSTMS